MVEIELERLLNDAKQNPSLKYELLKIKQGENPVENFCRCCRAKGYNINIGELFASGLDANDAKLRSVNGGGVNGIDGWDDTFEQFYASLEWT